MNTNEQFSDEKLVVPPRNLDELVAEIRKVFSYDRVNVDYMNAVLGSYKSNPKDWRKYAKFDQHRYTRNLVDEGNGKYNLMLLCWGEGMGSSIHDHANADCFVKVLQGELMETRFAWPSESEPEKEMEKIGCTVYGKDGVTYMCDEIGLHRMENPSHTEPAVTLHLYCPPFMECQTFDQKTGHRNTARMTFWSRYGTRTPFKVTSSPADPVPASQEVLAVCDAENN